MRLFNVCCCVVFLMLPSYASSISELSIDAGGGVAADLLVDTIGTVSCSGTCGGLTFLPAITPHGTLIVSGTIGTFTISTLAGVGGVAVSTPALLNLTQNEASSTVAGTLTVSFSDTDYGLGGGHAFGTAAGSAFEVSATSNPDFGIGGSIVTGEALIDSANTLGGGIVLDGPFAMVGLATHDNVVGNPIGATGSLTTITSMHFLGRGNIQSTFTISSSGGSRGNVPEPATLSMAGGALLALGLLRRRKRARA